MIATHNIKVNGRWYKAGDEYELEEQVAEPEVVEEPVVEEEKPKPRATAARRKKVSE